MPVISRKEEVFVIKGLLPDVAKRIHKALFFANFSGIKIDLQQHQMSGTYRRFSVYGEIVITLQQEEEEQVTVIVKSVSNADNIFALLGRPNRKILSQFKDSLLSQKVS